MRQAILVVLLVSASFLGGAFVNGPGLSWAQTRVLRSLGLGDGGEIASVDLGATSNPDAISDGSARTKPEAERMRGPVAPVPSLVTEGESSEQDAPDGRSVPKPRLKSKPGRDGGSPPSRPSLSPSAKSEPALAASPSRRQVAPLDPSITPAVAASPLEPAREPAPASTPPPSPSPLERKIPPAILDTLAELLPPKPPISSGPSSSSLSSPSSPVAPNSAVEGGDDWAVLQRKMQTLGVSRFTVDGDPGGRVVFSCLIPLAGRQAVSQRFEAEGDDVVGAAQAALRRVALWRATQP